MQNSELFSLTSEKIFPCEYNLHRKSGHCVDMGLQTTVIDPSDMAALERALDEHEVRLIETFGLLV